MIFSRSDSLTEETANLRDELAKCAKCGKCRAVCPVFLEVHDEGMVARGRIALAEAVLEGKLEFTGKVSEYLSTCIKCLRCVANCPSGVAYDLIIMELTRALAREKGISPSARMMFRFVLPHRRLFDLMIRVAAAAQRLVPLQRRGVMRHLPLFFMGRRWIPTIARDTALKRLRHVRGIRNPKMRVAFFTGCLINYVYPNVADSVVRVLNRLGVDVVVPGEQVCCGTPVLSFGDYDAARRLARINADCFRRYDVDYIVVACASGGKAMKLDYPRLLGGEWEGMRGRVKDVIELVAELGRPDLAALAEDVTYHDPCHLRWGQDVYEQPRELLRQASRYIEMEDADRCCGCGGAFSVFHYDYAVQIGERKIRAIKASGANSVATGCPGCMMHMADRLADAGVSVPVVHTIEVIERALEGGGRSDKSGQTGRKSVVGAGRKRA